MKAVADTGCTVIVTGGKVGEMALHFLNKYKIMTVRYGPVNSLEKQMSFPSI